MQIAMGQRARPPGAVLRRRLAGAVTLVLVIACRLGGPLGASNFAGFAGDALCVWLPICGNIAAHIRRHTCIFVAFDPLFKRGRMLADGFCWYYARSCLFPKDAASLIKHNIVALGSAPLAEGALWGHKCTDIAIRRANRVKTSTTQLARERSLDQLYKCSKKE